MFRWQVLGVATAAVQGEGDSLEVGMQRTVVMGLCDSHRLHVLIAAAASPQRTVPLRWLGMAFVSLHVFTLRYHWLDAHFRNILT